MDADRDKIEYTFCCLTAFAEKHSVGIAETYRCLASFGGLDFLDGHYEVEHTLSVEDAVEDMETVCRRNGADMPYYSETGGQTDGDVRFCVESIGIAATAILAGERGWSIRQAMDALLPSATFRKVENRRTGLYFQSPEYGLEMLNEELKDDEQR